MAELKHQNDDEKEKQNQAQTSHHIVLSFGKNNKFQTGHNIKNNIFSPTVIKLKKETNPIFIASGFDHSGIIDTFGNVTLWGNNGQHQISNCNKSPHVLPHRLSFSMHITQIAATSDSSVGSAMDFPYTVQLCWSAVCGGIESR